jgi:hypothetical protein
MSGEVKLRELWAVEHDAFNKNKMYISGPGGKKHKKEH